MLLSHKNTEWFVVAFALKNKAEFSLETENAFQRSWIKGFWKPHNTSWRQVKELHHTVVSVLLLGSCLFCPPAVPSCPLLLTAKTVSVINEWASHHWTSWMWPEPISIHRGDLWAPFTSAVAHHFLLSQEKTN